MKPMTGHNSQEPPVITPWQHAPWCAYCSQITQVIFFVTLPVVRSTYESCEITTRTPKVIVAAIIGSVFDGTTYGAFPY